MREPNPRSSRLALAGGLIAATALASAGFLVGRSTMPKPQATAPAPQPLPSPSPTSKVQDEFDRAALLALANLAADAFAAKLAMPAEVTEATGRRFDLVMPFGCAGSSDPKSTAAMRWRYDPESSTLRAAVVPTTWQAADWGVAEGSGPAPALRGFGIPRPWTSSTACIPMLPQPPESSSLSPPPPAETLAIARWINEGENGKVRSFDIVRRVSPKDFAPNQGLRLRIVGRIAAPAGASPVRCIQPLGSDHRPSCLITASFAEIRIESATTGAVLGSWPIEDVSAKTL